MGTQGFWGEAGSSVESEDRKGPWSDGATAATPGLQGLAGHSPKEGARGGLASAPACSGCHTAQLMLPAGQLCFLCEGCRTLNVLRPRLHL